MGNELYFDVSWQYVNFLDVVFLRGTHEGKFKPYGPFLVSDKEKRELLNPQGKRFVHMAEELCYGPGEEVALHFEGTSEDSYKVSVCGFEVGEVFKGWSRLGGNGWTHNLQVSPRTWKTRKEATLSLFYKWRSIERNKVFQAKLQETAKQGD